MHKKIIICQHPMPLLIQKGEKEILERQPPWGERSVLDYLERINRNLDFIENRPGFKLNYEISALEIELINKIRPDIVSRLKKNLTLGNIGFVGGTYSQPHLQIHDSESSFLQFDFGHEVFSNLFGHSFRTYATQETGLHQQLPQILNYFGYKYSTVPAFYWSLDFLPNGDIPTLVGNWLHMSFMHDNSTCYWEGIDGTRIPLFLEITDRWSDDFFFRKEQKGLFGESNLYIFFPDLIEIDDEFALKISKKGETYLLDSSLEEEFTIYTPKSNAHLSTYWSYIEGTHANATLREQNLAITSVQQAESLAAISLVLIGTNQPSYKDLWRRILSTQHHDVHWCETKRLKEDAKDNLRACVHEASVRINKIGREILERVHLSNEAKYKLAVFNTLPIKRVGPVYFELSFDPGASTAIQIHDQKGNVVPFQVIKISRFPDGSINKCRYLVITEMEALGYKVFGICQNIEENSRSFLKNSKSINGFIFTNPFFKIEFNRTGIIDQFFLTNDEFNLLGKDGAAWFAIEGKKTNTNGSNSHSSINQINDGPICSILETSTVFDTYKTHIDTEIILYKNLPRIDFCHNILFNQTNIANLWDDEDKLNWFWALNFRGQITHDIPFGILEEKVGRPILCPSWMEYGDGKQGITIAQKSHPKFWVKNQLVGNVIAWGGKNVSNRQHRFWVDDAEFNVSLNGNYFAEHAVFPHQGSWKDTNIPQKVRCYREPLIAVVTENGNKKSTMELPSEVSLVSINQNNLLPTSTRIINNLERSFIIRFFETFGEKTSLRKISTSKLINISKINLDGEEISDINKYEIGQIKCMKVRY